MANSCKLKCPACDSPRVSIFYEVNDVPIHGTAILPSRKAALGSPRGDLILGACKDCGFITNTAYDPSLFKEHLLYEDQQGFSPTFVDYMESISAYLIDKYDLRKKNIIEIGCGKGDFLELLRRKGANSCVGIDPLSDPDRAKSDSSSSLRFVNELFDIKHKTIPCDFLCCRHTLEHIENPADFLKTIRQVLDEHPNAKLFFEVPDTYRILRDVAFWDIYYEHCSYFSETSLGSLFQRSGFKLIDLKKVYGGQYLVVEAEVEHRHVKEGIGLNHDRENASRLIDDFTKRFGKLIHGWKQNIRQRSSSGQKIVVWGSGSKCVAFLSTLRIKDEIDVVVDINPHRHHKYIPGSGREIMPPSFMKAYQPDLVIVMNSIYESEIKHMLHKLSVYPEMACL